MDKITLEIDALLDRLQSDPFCLTQAQRAAAVKRLRALVDQRAGSVCAEPITQPVNIANLVLADLASARKEFGHE